MKKSMQKIGMFLFTFLASICIYTNSLAANTIDQNSLMEMLQEETTLDGNQIDLGEVLQVYEELSEKYTNDELADIIEEHSSEIEEQGISKEMISAGTKVLRTVDEKELNRILKEDLNIDEIKERLEEGDSAKEVLTDLQNEMSTLDKVTIAVKLFLTSSIVKTIAIVIIVLFLYNLIIRAIIYHKANKHAIAAFIPIYKQVTQLKLCGMSPWWLLLLLLPIIGWFILAIIWLVTRFEMAEAFGRGAGFAIGLVLLGPIFETILAFNKNIIYIGWED